MDVSLSSLLRLSKLSRLFSSRVGLSCGALLLHVPCFPWLQVVRASSPIARTYLFLGRQLFFFQKNPVLLSECHPWQVSSLGKTRTRFCAGRERERKSDRSREGIMSSDSQHPPPTSSRQSDRKQDPHRPLLRDRRELEFTGVFVTMSLTDGKSGRTIDKNKLLEVVGNSRKIRGTPITAAYLDNPFGDEDAGVFVMKGCHTEKEDGSTGPIRCLYKVSDGF